MQCYIYVLCLPYIEINPITVAAFGLLAGSAVVVVVVRLFTVGKAVEKSGAYFN